MTRNKGLNNDHELLKHAITEDSESGMVKYSIDLDESMEKESKNLEEIINAESKKDRTDS